MQLSSDSNTAVACDLQGTVVMLSLCSVVSGDARWANQGNQLAPDVYNPDRYTYMQAAFLA